jgi:hypothetical protein
MAFYLSGGAGPDDGCAGDGLTRPGPAPKPRSDRTRYYLYEAPLSGQLARSAAGTGHRPGLYIFGRGAHPGGGRARRGNFGAKRSVSSQCAVVQLPQGAAAFCNIAMVGSSTAPARGLLALAVGDVLFQYAKSTKKSRPAIVARAATAAMRRNAVEKNWPGRQFRSRVPPR